MYDCIKRGFGIFCICVLLLPLTGCKSFKEADAVAVTQATLDLVFQGDVDAASSVLAGSREDLLGQYTDGITLFLDGNVSDEIDISGTHYLLYRRLMEEVFRSSKYRVEEAVKESDTRFMVTVAICPTDIFQKARPKLIETAMRIEKQAADGHYVGSATEIEDQMNFEFLRDAYEVLESAYFSASYQDEVRLLVPVEKGENGEFSVPVEEQFIIIEKILGIDTM